MSLLGHLVPGWHPERAATIALAHILDPEASPGMASAFVDLVGETGSLNFEPHRVAPDLDQNDDSQPDMTIYDAAEQPRVIVEAAFWEGVPAAQPVGYLLELPGDLPSALVLHRTAKAASVPVGDPARALCGRSGDRSRGRTPNGRSGPGAGRRPCPPGCELGVRARDPAASHRGSGRRTGHRPASESRETDGDGGVPAAGGGRGGRRGARPPPALLPRPGRQDRTATR